MQMIRDSSTNWSLVSLTAENLIFHKFNMNTNQWVARFSFLQNTQIGESCLINK